MLIARTTTQIEVYVHQGKKADLLKSVTTSLGAKVTINHASIADPEVYKLGRYNVTVPGPTPSQPTWEPTADCRYPLRCETKGRWVVKSYDMTTDKGTQGPPETHTFEYAEGRTDALRGWLGFAQRIETDAHHGKFITTYENWRKEGNKYPYAFLPKMNGYIAQTADQDFCDSCDVYRTITTNTYGYVESTVNGNKFYRTRLTNSVTAAEGMTIGQSNLVPQFFQSSDLWASLQRSDLKVTAFTAYDDPVDSQVAYPTETVTTHNDYFPDQPDKWLIGRPSQTTVLSAAAGKANVRITAFTYDGDTKLPKTVTVQPTSTNDVKSVTTLTRGAGGFGQVTKEVVAATATADDPRGVGTALTRTTTTVYAQVDGVTPTSMAKCVNCASTPVWLTSSYAYHGGLGVLAQSSDFNGVVTTRKFDGFGRPVSEQTPQRGTLTYSYEAPPGLPAQAPQAARDVYNVQTPVFAIQRKQTGGEQSWTTYNQQGHEVLQTVMGGDGVPLVSLTTYTDFVGEVASQSRPSSSTYLTTSFGHDNLGRITEKLQSDTLRYFYSYHLQTNGLGVTTVNPRSVTSYVVMDDRGRLRSSTEPVFNGDVVTNYEYGPFGDLNKVTLPPIVGNPNDPATLVNGSTVYTYDNLGRRIDMNDADRGHSTRSYNAFGEVVKEVDAANKVTTFKRDDLGRVIETSATGDPGVNKFVWDPANGKGKLDYSLSFDGVRKTYTYDANGMPEATYWTIGGTLYTFWTKWDANGRLSYTTYPMMGTQMVRFDYAYDQVGQVNAVRRFGDAEDTWKVVARTDDNLIKKDWVASGFTTDRTFHPTRKYVETIKSTHPTLGSVLDLVYTHDDVGNVTGRKDNVANSNETFDYTNHDGLKKWNWVSPAVSETIDPSPNGAISSRMDLASRLTYPYDYLSPLSGPRTGGMHAVQSVRGGGSLTKQLTYDATGNQTKTFSGHTVVYNSFNLPTSIMDASGSNGAFFTYDAEGTRATKTSGSSSAPTITLYAGQLYERRMMPTGETVHVFYVPAAGRIVAQETWIEKPAGTFAKAETLYLHHDIVGSVVAVSAKNFTFNRSTFYRYDPYGRRIASSNPSLIVGDPPTNYYHPASKVFYTMNLGFTGHEMDDDIGLINMKGRMYDAKLGRFLTPDPVTRVGSKAAGWDRYAYVFNNPLKWTDPSGFSPEGPPGAPAGPIVIQIPIGGSGGNGSGGSNGTTGGKNDLPISCGDPMYCAPKYPDSPSSSPGGFVPPPPPRPPVPPSIGVASGGAPVCASPSASSDDGGGTSSSSRAAVIGVPVPPAIMAIARGMQATAEQLDAHKEEIAVVTVLAPLVVAGAVEAGAPTLIWLGKGAGVRALGGAVAGGVSGAFQGKDADAVVVQALVNGALSAANPGGALVGSVIPKATPLANIVGGSFNSAASNFLSGAANGQVSGWSMVGAAGGRFAFGVLTGGIGGSALETLEQRLIFDTGSGLVSGLVGGTVRSVQQGAH